MVGAAVRQPKPSWLKVRIPAGQRVRAVRGVLSRGGLHTVCEEARCPNQAECWDSGTATFMILGQTCTRGCAFCAVRRGDPAGVVDRAEGERVADAAKGLRLEYVVVTSVTRDDLPDGGAAVFADTVRALRALTPAPKVELLIPDYSGPSLDTVLAAEPDVLAHNIEVVERMTPRARHPRFSYRRSLEVLTQAKERAAGLVTKSSIMLGIGETEEEVERAMADLVSAGVGILALGQYLQPTPDQASVREYVTPEKFGRLAERGRALGFGFVAAGPLVRTSYRASAAYVLQSSGAQE